MKITLIQPLMRMRPMDTKLKTRMSPSPGTAQYERLLAENRITSFDNTYYTTSEVVFTPAKMDADQLKSGYLKIYKDIYSVRNIFRRFPRHQRIGYFLFNFIYRKYGKLTERICDFVGFNRIGYICEKLSFNL